MKKTLLILLLVLSMTLTLVACGGNTKDPVDTSDATETKEFEPEKITADKINPRDAVVDYMYEMANVEWTPEEDIDSSSVQPELFYKKGVKYTGIMYVTGSRTLTDAEEFRTQLDENGVYTGPNNSSKGYGNHCSSSLRLAYDRVSSDIKFTYTGGMAPQMEQGMLPLGNYEYKTAYATSYGIYEKNPNKDVFVEAFALLQKGDAILTSWPKEGGDPNVAQTGHARMIISVHIEKNAAGKINPHKSYVTTIEQTSSFDKQAKDGVNTTWYVEHQYTFTKLIEDKYIPLTIAAFDAEKQDTEFKANKLNSEKNVTGGSFRGIIRSNFLPINSVTCEVLDKDGNVVVTQTLKNKNTDTKLEFFFNAAKQDEGFTTLSAGDYVYEVKVNTAYGPAKVYHLEFTVE